MKSSKGFTLIELLVVIAVIAILMAILMPALQLAKKKAAGIVCSSRQKQLTLAWVMYADDNDDKIVNSDTYKASGDRRYWVEPPQTEDGTQVGIGTMTLVDRKRGIEKGALFPYINSVDFYHCPSDDRQRFEETSSQCAFRSYSITSGLNSDWAVAGGGADHIAYKNRSDIKNPSVALVFVEEAEKEQGFNHHSWALWVQRPEFYDPLAVFHGESCTLGFADGHARSYRFRTKAVLDEFRAGTKTLRVDRTNDDYRFFKEHFPYKSLQ